MLAILLGTLYVGFLFAMYRIKPLPTGETATDKRRLIHNLFRLWIMFSIAYHLSYFFLIGLRSLLAMVPIATGTMVIVGLVLMKVTPPDPNLDPVDHSPAVIRLFTASGLITFLFLIIPFGFAGVI